MSAFACADSAWTYRLAISIWCEALSSSRRVCVSAPGTCEERRRRCTSTYPINKVARRGDISWRDYKSAIAICRTTEVGGGPQAGMHAVARVSIFEPRAVATADVHSNALPCTGAPAARIRRAHVRPHICWQGTAWR